MLKYIIAILIMFPNFLSIANDYRRVQYDTLRNQLIEESNQYIALQKAFELLNFAKDLKNDTLIGRSNIEISFNYRALSNFPNALEYALKAATIFEKCNNTDELAISYDAIGSIYTDLHNYELSIKYKRQAILLIEKEDDQNLLSGFYNNLGDNFRLLQQYDSALLYFQKSKEIFDKQDYKSGIAYGLCNIGLTHFQASNGLRGMDLMKQAIQLFDSLGDYSPIAYLYIEIAKRNISNGNYTQAKHYANLANEIIIENNFTNQLMEVLKIQSEIAIHDNDYKSAYDYTKQSQVLNDSLYNSQITSQLAEKRTEFEISRKETEIKYLQKISRTQRIAAAFLGLLLISIIVFAIYLYKTSKRRKAMNLLLAEQNHELDQKNHIIHLALEEKDILIKEIHHRVKNNLQIISSLINLQAMRVEDPTVHDVLDEMQRRIMAISSIHQKLYQGESVAFINMKEYLDEVINSIHIAFDQSNHEVEYQVDIQDIQLSIDFAVPIGLMINELATNSYKYAFKKTDNNLLKVALIKSGNEDYELTLADTGPGLPEGIVIEKSQSLGLRMVVLLTRQIKGSFSYTFDQGAVFKIRFNTNTTEK